MEFTSILFVFLFIWCTTTVVESHSVMTHTSLDVGNIISIVIPENSSTNINIDQLTLDFRRQLERIKQNQILKSDYKSVFLKNKPSDISNNRDHKNYSTKTYQGKINYHSPQNFRFITNFEKIIKKKFRAYKQHPLYYAQKKKLERYNDVIIHKNQRMKHRKLEKTSQTNPIRRDFYQFHKFDNTADDDNYQEKSTGDDKNVSKDWKLEEAVENSANKINQVKVSSGTYQNSEQRAIQLTEPRVESSCLVVNKANRVENIRDVTTDEFEKNGVITNDCTEEIDADGQVISSCYNDSIVNSLKPTKSSNTEETNYESKDKNYDLKNNGNDNGTMYSNDDDKAKQKIFPINIQVVDFKEVEQIIRNPEDILNRFNSSDADNDIKTDDDDDDNSNIYVRMNDNLQNAALLTSINREDRHFNHVDDSKGLTNSLYEYTDKNRNLTDDEEPVALASDRITYRNNMQDIQKTKPDNAGIDNESFEIRIRRSVNDNVLLKKSMKAHVPKPDVKQWKSKVKGKTKWVPMKTSMKSKNSRKIYPNIKSINQ